MIALAIAASARAESIPYFAEIAVELAEGQKLPLSDSIRFTLVSPNSAAIAERLQTWENIRIERADDHALLILLTGSSRSSDKVTDRYLTSSFVIDFDEVATQRFVAGFKADQNATPDLNKMAEYVRAYIDKPSYIHGFNVASRVANQRSGDCTEYAVLATALARALGFPSRVVLGSLILEQEHQVVTYGHAWSEVWQKGRWRILDAAMVGSKEVKHFYVPATELENEGPGYSLALVKAMTLFPQKIIQLRNYQ